MSLEEIYDLDIEKILEQKFYCHLCEEEGVEQELETFYYTEEIQSFSSQFNKYIGIAEKGCPKPNHAGVKFKIQEEFYSESE